MNAHVQKLVEKARRSLEAGKDLLRNGHPDFAVSRAYYTMFYLAEALLLTKGLAFSKHSAVIAAFGQHFTKAGLLPAALHEHLRSAFEERQIGDYDYKTP